MVKDDGFPNLFDRLPEDRKAELRFRMGCFSPLDAKYADQTQPMQEYLSVGAEWLGCVRVQRTLLETRVEFGQAKPGNLAELDAAIPNINPANIALLEDHEKLRHDQLAVLEELGRHISPETKALLHPGTTSYDILDTARSYLFRGAWNQVMRPEVNKTIEQLSVLSEKAGEILQVGRTHLQDTSPVPLTTTFALYAARLAERVERCDYAFKGLKGKISGIVGTGASIDMVIGTGKSLAFERAVLDKLGLVPDYTATQIVQKERLLDVGNAVTSLMHVVANFSNDMRILYSSAIKEVTNRDNAARLGGSSADAGKNNPIQLENLAGTVHEVESGMRVLYGMMSTDLQRDLRASRPARLQPQNMITSTYEAFRRLGKTLKTLSVNEDRMAANLEPVRENPSEAMTAILRGESGWTHSRYGVGHDFVKEMSKRRQAERNIRPLLAYALEDPEFETLYQTMPEEKKKVLKGELERYTGSAIERASLNREYARSIISK
jgi:adenylosuccinate lyase